MKKITEKHIVETAKAVLSECVNAIPLERWITPPAGIEISPMKAKYGEAISDGKIVFNQHFVGTTAFTKLDQTIRHEYAHLAVGLHHHHDKHFIRCLERFGGDKAVPEREEQEIRERITYKWTVIAHLADGSQRSVGGVHRRTKRYSEYHLLSTSRQKDVMRDSGLRVVRYEFIEN